MCLFVREPPPPIVVSALEPLVPGDCCNKLDEDPGLLLPKDPAADNGDGFGAEAAFVTKLAILIGYQIFVVAFEYKYKRLRVRETERREERRDKEERVSNGGYEIC